MPKLFMLLLGASIPGRHIEQHDVFFGIAESIKELVPAIKNFWPEAKEKLHIDAWRDVQQVNGYKVSILPATVDHHSPVKLFFINLGGYKLNEFEEFHYKMLVAATDKSAAIARAKQTAFFRHTGIKGAASHIDDKYGIDVDDVFAIGDILPQENKNNFHLLVEQEAGPEDSLHLGYFKLSSFI